MFRITEDPSSGSLVQCLAKNYKNDSIVSVDMCKVGVMAAYSDLFCVCVHCICTQHIYSDPLCMCVVHCIYTQYIYSDPLCMCVVHCIYSELHTHTHNRSEYAAITPPLYMSTDTIESFL